MPTTYRDAGVDVDAGNELVRRIAPLAKKTRHPQVIADIGGFSGLCAVPPGMRDPVLVGTTDGVGTKLKLAFLLDRHDTVGIDLVAMCVNDLACVGARPLFFLDYFATAKLDVDRAEKVIAGIARGCAECGCALLGGETAELPGFYAPGEYDLAGFAVGVLERDQVIDGHTVVEGDVLVGVASSGVHSNGYSLVRRIVEQAKLDLARPAPGFDRPLGEVLLEPTRLYPPLVAALRAKVAVKAVAHITGGGLLENPPRVVPQGLGLRFDRRSWPEPPIFDFLRRTGDVPEPEMLRTFNLGLGLVVAVAPPEADAAIAALAEHRVPAWKVGVVTRAATEERVTFEG
ncbi:MAG: phosphoribosylformylglycinamidine cyclo-ligase [Deltaproteobacteria bacterium]|nr:phosphoribosylformylglycinamidine cyclo-ligase [Deltaproteobacteria bacterium]